MPCHKRRIQRHFASLTIRDRFASERLLTPPPSSLRTAYSFDDTAQIRYNTSHTPETPPNDEDASVSPIPKPRGEVSRAYNLQVSTKWDDSTYAKIQASRVTSTSSLDSHSSIQSTVQTLIAEYLDSSRPFTQQDNAQLDVLISQVGAHYIGVLASC